MDTTTDHFTPLALRVRGNNINLIYYFKHIIANCPWADSEVVKGVMGILRGLANREVRVQLMFIGIIEEIL